MFSGIEDKILRIYGIENIKIEKAEKVEFQHMRRKRVDKLFSGKYKDSGVVINFDFQNKVSRDFILRLISYRINLKISYLDFAVVRIAFIFGGYEKQVQDMNFEDKWKGRRREKQER